MVDEQIRRHCEQIDRCNQRGGRMLSVVDLIEAGTLGPDLAAYALAAIAGGASFLVGAAPGGAGKTTVMGALLNFVPADVPLLPADGMASIRQAAAGRDGRRCYLCHEIGAGPYYAYLWGAELRAYFDLPAAGHMLATNLHADTYEQARRQICADNAVSEQALRRINLMFFLSVERSRRGVARRIEQVWESDGAGPHRLIFDRPAGQALGTSELVTDADLSRARETIEAVGASGARRIEDVRAAILARPA
ncbi:MAG TPA: hypothetical protein VM389_14860 [Phycisphaerae bacterium]|nr:hypothetical protein [Phycisphaerae bacterium]